MQEQKYIALIDCDCFFVSCERRINPDLLNKPVCVVSGDRGCVISRSVEAKQMGIPMGLPLFMAKEQYPDCIYINANHSNYSQFSNEVMSILKNFSPNVQVYSIDEAFVDFTGLAKLYKMNYYKLAQYLREKIYCETNIPVSIGVSRTKTLAKLASDKSKYTKSHVCICGKKGIRNFLKNTNIEDVWGIGRHLGPKLKGHGIYSAHDYIIKNDLWLKSRFGKNGLEIKYELLGNLINKIKNDYEPPKSISDTRSFSEFTSDKNYLKNELMVHIHNACRKLRQANCKCNSVGLILKTKDFQVILSKNKLEQASDFEFDISEVAFKELNKVYNSKILYRSIGILLEDFGLNSSEQLGLFDNNIAKEKSEKLGKALDKLELKFGKNIVKTGFTNKGIPEKQDFITKN